MVSEYSKLTQKNNKSRHDWASKGIYWKLCKRLKFDHTNKWYIHKPEPVQENETPKIFWDFEIQTESRQEDQI